MYLSPLSVKTKHARVGSFTTYLGCPRFRERKCALSHSEHIQHRQFYNMSGLMFRLNTPAGGVDVSGVEPLSKQIISYTLYILVNVPMISQNIRFKPLQSRSKALSAASWLITPLISYGASERIKTWLKIYRNPHDTKILRGLYSAFLIHLAGFNLAHC